MIKRSVNEVKALYAKYNNESEVARELGISRQSLYDFRIRHGIPYNAEKAKKKTHDAQYGERNENIIAAYQSGVTMAKLCAKFKMNAPAINYILTKYSVKKPAIHHSHERNLDIQKLRDKGMPIKEIAELYHMDRFYISTMLCKLKKKGKL